MQTQKPGSDLHGPSSAFLPVLGDAAWFMGLIDTERKEQLGDPKRVSTRKLLKCSAFNSGVVAFLLHCCNQFLFIPFLRP